MWGDEGQLRQLFQNLIGNGIKFRADDPPRVEVTAERQATRWLFRVSDNGIGIDPRHVERIFSVFKRLHGRDEYPGSGIGLSICKRIVERHHGRISVERSPTGGSSFCFTIRPRAAPDGRFRGRRERVNACPITTGGRASRQQPEDGHEPMGFRVLQEGRMAIPQEIAPPLDGRREYPAASGCRRTASTERSRYCWWRTTLPTPASPARCSRAAGCPRI